MILDIEYGVSASSYAVNIKSIESATEGCKW